MWRILFLLIMVPMISVAQEFWIVDRASSSGVTYANISFYNNNQNVGGTYSSAEGLVILPMEDFIDSILVSCIGYRSYGVSLNGLKDSIKLSEEVFHLPEVQVGAAQDIETTFIGYNTIRRSQGHTSVKGQQIVVFIENGFKKSVQIDSFHFICNRGKTNKNAKLKVIFFENNKGIPGKAYHQHIILPVKDLSDKKVKVKVDSLNIWMPVEGLFAGIEWMGCVDPDEDEIEILNSTCELTVMMNHVKDQKLEGVMFERNVLRSTPWYDVNTLMKVNLSMIPVFGISVFE